MKSDDKKRSANTPAIPGIDPKTMPANTPTMAALKSPARHRIPGLTDTIPNLRSSISKSDLPDGVKAYVDDQLSKVTTNAATIHLHDVAHDSGAFDLHLTIKPFTLG